ncbi:MAG: LOG family protein [Bacteroidota bacterium]
MKRSVSNKAYRDQEFLNSPDARTIRILAEFLEPFRRFRKNKVRDTIVFFGSSRIKTRKSVRAKIRELKKQIQKTHGQRKKNLEQQLDTALVDLEMSKYYDECVELARLLTEWSKSIDSEQRFIVCSGGGPGLMEAANKGAQLAGGKSIGLNISLTSEQASNPYISPELNFEFHYFFMRKFWFVYLGKALIVFPGGFGTMDELMELLTLLQTGKIRKKMSVIIYGRSYWEKIINFDALVKFGMIDAEDMSLFTFADTPQEAFTYLKKELLRNYPKKKE